MIRFSYRDTLSGYSMKQEVLLQGPGLAFSKVLQSKSLTLVRFLDYHMAEISDLSENLRLTCTKSDVIFERSRAEYRYSWQYKV